MTGDRALDLFIAERVMGFKWTGCGEPFRYSSDPAACSALKAKLRETLDWFNIYYADGAHHCETSGNYPVPSAESEEMAVALFARVLVEAGVLK